MNRPSCNLLVHGLEWDESIPVAVRRSRFCIDERIQELGSRTRSAVVTGDSSVNPDRVCQTVESGEGFVDRHRYGALTRTLTSGASRRRMLKLSGGALLGAGAAGAGASVRPTGVRSAHQATPAASTRDEILAITRQVMDELALRATILHITIDGDVLVTDALGESMTGVPATTDMRFRNGAVAISLMSTLMLTLVEDGVIGLDDPIGDLVPDLPESETATFRMLANMTAGYRDHVQSTVFENEVMEDPFKTFTSDDILAYSLAQPRLFAPGTNWEYSHSNYFILALALEAATGQTVEQLMQERVLNPLHLTATTNAVTGEIPEPTLHAFSSERRGWLEVDPGKSFYEESTYWNPSWTLPAGAVQSTNIQDFAASMVAVGEGTLLSEESKAAQLDRGLLGFGELLEGCNSCHTLGETYNYGLGVVLRGPWILQNPLFFGYSGVSAYWPERKISIAVANTYDEAAFDMSTGEYNNASVPLFQAIADVITPDLATPKA